MLYKQCKNSGRFFISSGKSDSEYCERIDTPSGKTCKEVGALNTFAQKHENDEINQAYTKAYRRMDSRKRTLSEHQRSSDSAGQAQVQSRLRHLPYLHPYPPRPALFYVQIFRHNQIIRLCQYLSLTHLFHTPVLLHWITCLCKSLNGSNGIGPFPLKRVRSILFSLPPGTPCQAS